MPLTRWSTSNATATLWTIKLVSSTLLDRGNNIAVNVAYARCSDDTYVIESMSMTTSMAKPKDDNCIRGRWAG